VVTAAFLGPVAPSGIGVATLTLNVTDDEIEKLYIEGMGAPTSLTVPAGWCEDTFAQGWYSDLTDGYVVLATWGSDDTTIATVAPLAGLPAYVRVCVDPMAPSGASTTIRAAASWSPITPQPGAALQLTVQ